MIPKIISLIWISAALVLTVGCASERNNNSPFQAQYVFGLAKPEVLIQNNSDRTIQVDLFRETQSNTFQNADKTWTISPSQTINATIEPGEYRYHATCPGVIPASGTSSFQKNYRYSWVFYIETRTY